jgi:hypothetical protein
LDEAVKHQSLIRNKGYTDAFVVPFKNGERISVAEAKEIENSKIKK